MTWHDRPSLPPLQQDTVKLEIGTTQPEKRDGENIRFFDQAPALHKLESGSNNRQISKTLFGSRNFQISKLFRSQKSPKSPNSRNCLGPNNPPNLQILGSRQVKTSKGGGATAQWKRHIRFLVRLSTHLPLALLPPSVSKRRSRAVASGDQAAG